MGGLCTKNAVYTPSPIGWVDSFAITTIKNANEYSAPQRIVARVVVNLGTTLLISPHGVQCVYYRTEIEEYVNDVWTSVLIEARSIDFFLYDPENPKAVLMCGGGQYIRPFAMTDFLSTSDTLTNNQKELLGRHTLTANPLNADGSPRKFRFKEITLSPNQMISVIAILKFVMLTTTTPATRVLNASPVSKQPPAEPGVYSATRYLEPNDEMWRQIISSPCIPITDSPRAFEGIVNGKRYIASVKSIVKQPNLPRINGTFIPASDYFSSDPVVARAVSDDKGYGDAVSANAEFSKPASAAYAPGADGEFTVQGFSAEQYGKGPDYLYQEAYSVYDERGQQRVAAGQMPTVNAETGFNTGGYNPSGVVSVGADKSNTYGGYVKNPNQSQAVSFTVPDGMPPGAFLNIVNPNNGQTIRIQLPPSVTPGQVVQINV